MQLQHFNVNLFSVTIIWLNAEVRYKEELAMSLCSSPIVYSHIAIQTCDKGQTPLHNHGSDESDGDMSVGLDEHFAVEWVIGEKEGEEGLAFKDGCWGTEGSDTKAPGRVGK